MQPTDDHRPHSFLTDLGAALHVWTQHPLLPLLSVIVVSLPDFVDLLSVLFTGCHLSTAVGCELGAGYTFVFSVLYVVLPGFLLAGWVGTERIWYLRAFNGKYLRSGEIRGFTFALMGRFVRLGLLVTLAMTPFVLVAEALPGMASVGFAILFLSLDLALTFVTPALAFTTHRALTALRIGIGMIRRHWPASAPFVLIPPFALLLLTRGLRAALPLGTGLLAAAVFGLANLWFKGAVARFYLRHHPTDPDYGAVYSNLDSRGLTPEVNPGSEDGA